MKDYYKILGVDRQASTEQIKKEINKSEYSSFLSILNIPNIEQDAKKNKITK